MICYRFWRSHPRGQRLRQCSGADGIVVGMAGLTDDQQKELLSQWAKDVHGLGVTWGAGEHGDEVKIGGVDGVFTPWERLSGYKGTRRGTRWRRDGANNRG